MFFLTGVAFSRLKTKGKRNKKGCTKIYDIIIKTYVKLKCNMYIK
jgi:hypothetical protein